MLTRHWPHAGDAFPPDGLVSGLAVGETAGKLLDRGSPGEQGAIGGRGRSVTECRLVVGAHEGQRFVVPRNSYDPKERHATLQSLMLVNQLTTMRLKRDNLKSSTTLFVGQ